MIPLSIETLYCGGAVERIKSEIQRVLENIIDPNTPPKATRKVSLTMTIKPNEQRNMAEVLVATSSTVCPASPIETSIYIGANPMTGEIGASEMASGENPMQNILPGAESSMTGKITKFATNN